MKAGSNGCKSAMWLLVPLVAAGMAFGKGGERRLSLEEFRDKMQGAWVGQMAGVAWGQPTEFKFVGDVKRDGWRAYVFRQGDHAVAAVWTNERQAELGRKKGRMLKLALPKDVRFVDLMGNRRSGVSDQVSGVSTDPCPLTTDHLFPIPLTPAPIFVVSHDAEGLLKVFEEAR